MKMSQAISRQVERYQLIGLTRSSPNLDDLFASYDTCQFPMQLLRYFRMPRFLDLCAWRAARLAKKQAPDVVYSRFIAGSVESTKLGLPTVTELHGEVWKKGARSAQMMEHLISSPATLGIVVISEALKKIFLEKYPNFSAEKLMVAHDGADPHDSTEPLVASETFRVGYVGSMNEGRGIEIIEALAKRFEETSVEFHLIGGTQEEVEYWRAKMPDNAQLHGYLSHAEVQKHLASMHVCLMPYQTSVKTGKNSLDTAAYASPLKMFEYMSMRMAIISSNLPVLQEVLNEKNSILVDCTDVDAWEAGLQQLWKDEEHRKAISNQAYEDFMSEYTWDKRAENLMAWCKSQLAAV